MQFVPALLPGTEQASTRELYLLPTTFTASESGMQTWAIEAAQPYINASDQASVDAQHPRDYTIIADTDSMTILTKGYRKRIAVVPFTAMHDPAQPDQPGISPFYYCVAESYWKCVRSQALGEDPKYELTITTGTSKTQASSFVEKIDVSSSTEINLTASAPAMLGGWGGGLKTTFGWDRSRTSSESQSQTDTSERVEKQTFTLKSASNTYFWQKVQAYTIYRSDGGIAAALETNSPDTTITQSTGRWPRSSRCRQVRCTRRAARTHIPRTPGAWFAPAGYSSNSAARSREKPGTTSDRGRSGTAKRCAPEGVRISAVRRAGSRIQTSRTPAPK
jgi:hypothetical protein